MIHRFLRIPTSYLYRIETKRFAIGLASYLSMTILVVVVVALVAPIVPGLAYWMGHLTAPKRAIWLFSGGATALFFLLIKLRILTKIGLLNLDVDENRVVRHMVGLPTILLVILTVVCFTLFLLTIPLCDYPVVSFRLEQNGTVSSIKSGAVIHARTGETLTFSVQHDPGTAPLCRWSLSGETGEIRAPHGCFTPVVLPETPGNTILSLEVSGGFFCQNARLYAFPLLIE